LVPAKVVVSHSKFRISKADRVPWEWLYYGRPKVAANLYFEEFVESSNGIAAGADADWYAPGFKTCHWKPAVEILGWGYESCTFRESAGKRIATLLHRSSADQHLP